MKRLQKKFVFIVVTALIAGGLVNGAFAIEQTLTGQIIRTPFEAVMIFEVPGVLLENVEWGLIIQTFDDTRTNRDTYLQRYIQVSAKAIDSIIIEAEYKGTTDGSRLRVVNRVAFGKLTFSIVDSKYDPMGKTFAVVGVACVDAGGSSCGEAIGAVELIDKSKP